jgi:hypothetical protein
MLRARITKLAKAEPKFDLHLSVEKIWDASFDYFSSHVFPIGTVERRRKLLAGRDLKAGDHIQSVARSARKSDREKPIQPL